MNYRENIKNCKKIVIKIGSTSIITPKGEINIEKLKSLTEVLSKLVKSGKEIVLVSSGAIALGATRLKFKDRPRDTLGQQVTASVGQVDLIQAYKELFHKNNQELGQILLTRNLFKDPIREKNLKNTLLKMMELKVIPIINENDTVSDITEDNHCDNDTMSAEICRIIEGELLILLTDIDGLYTENPKANSSAKIINHIEKIDTKIENIAGASSSKFGTGGMNTKVLAAKIVSESKGSTIICSGKDFNILFDVLDGKEVGTLFS